MSDVSVLVVYPRIGSVWLDDVRWHPDHVEGSVWDYSDCGNPYLPDDFPGEPVWMCFPLSSVVKVHASDLSFIRDAEGGLNV